MKIGFHSNQLCLRGTEVALYDYAHFNEVILGNQSFIFTNKNAPNHQLDAVYKFGTRFPVFSYENFSELESNSRELGIDAMYFIKAGFNDGMSISSCRTLVHSVFKYHEPHGDIYAYVSEWLSNTMSGGKLPFVPHMINLPECSEDLREGLDIPRDALVFGRYGGNDTFDLPFVHEIVYRVANENSKVRFLFMNTDQFCIPHPRIIHLPGTSDPIMKVKFINSCDAMLHARASGETFGLSIGEFSVKNKPIFTWTGSHERAHIELLGETGVYYNGAEDLYTTLLSFLPNKALNFDVYSERFGPEQVMRKFQAVFLSS